MNKKFDLETEWLELSDICCCTVLYFMLSRGILQILLLVFENMLLWEEALN